MGWSGKRRTRGSLMVRTPTPRLLCISLCLVSACALMIMSTADGRRTLDIRNTSSRGAHGYSIQGLSGAGWRSRRSTAETARRHLSGPGSFPPRCTAKCGSCTPCRPVHVPVPPGTPVTTEYYPEAWRCKCGNRLYMP